MTIAEARAKSVCRVCGEPIKLLCPVRVLDRYDSLDWPERVTLRYGKEFAHMECLESVTKKFDLFS